MKREILFRAYQKDFKRICSVINIGFCRDKISSITVDTIGRSTGYDHTTYSDGDEEFPLSSLVLMQYTGIKDKDGTKIFEGDILKDVYTGSVFTVFFVGGGFVVESNPKYFGYGDQGGTNPTEELSNMQTRSYTEDNFEVIGNIYENKELLK